MYTSRRRYLAATSTLRVSPCSRTALVMAVPLSASVTLRLSAFVTTCRVPLPEAVPELRVSLSVPAEAGAV